MLTLNHGKSSALYPLANLELRTSKYNLALAFAEKQKASQVQNDGFIANAQAMLLQQESRFSKEYFDLNIPIQIYLTPCSKKHSEAINTAKNPNK